MFTLHSKQAVISLFPSNICHIPPLFLQQFCQHAITQPTADCGHFRGKLFTFKREKETIGGKQIEAIPYVTLLEYFQTFFITITTTADRASTQIATKGFGPLRRSLPTFSIFVSTQLKSPTPHFMNGKRNIEEKRTEIVVFLSDKKKFFAAPMQLAAHVSPKDLARTGCCRVFTDAQLSLQANFMGKLLIKWRRIDITKQ